ncbi:MAG TPA: hypothetical protein VF731_05605 [Solirubrobacterales bacterium]
MKHLKVLGLALVAIFALSAVAAQGAFAAEEFHSEKQNTIITAEQQAGAAGIQILEIEGGLKVECSTFKAEGTSTATAGSGSNWTAPSITVRPEYKGSPATGGMTKCDSFLGHETVEVTTNECHYKLFAATTAEHALTSVICPTGKKIEISGGGLTLKIGGGAENENLTGVRYTNLGSGTSRNVTVKAEVAGIHYTCEPEFTCFLAGVPNSGSNAKYTGASESKGFEDLGGPAAETKGYTEGSQVGIWRE